MWEFAVHPAVACDIYDGVFFVLPFFPLGVLDEILNLIESVSESFPSYAVISILKISILGKENGLFILTRQICIVSET